MYVCIYLHFHINYPKSRKFKSLNSMKKIFFTILNLIMPFSTGRYSSKILFYLLKILTLLIHGFKHINTYLYLKHVHVYVRTCVCAYVISLSFVLILTSLI